MSLHRFLAHLNGAFVPQLPTEAAALPGWLPLLRRKLAAVRDHPPTSRAQEAAVYAEIHHLFAARPEDVKRYLDAFERAGQTLVPRLPGTHNEVGTVGTDHLPTNEIGDLAKQIVDAIDEHLKPHAPAPAPAGESA